VGRGENEFVDQQVIANRDRILHRSRGHLHGLHDEGHSNNAMITVTTADSKYSRMTVFGGPGSVSFSAGVSRSRPFARTGRAVNTPAFRQVFRRGHRITHQSHRSVAYLAGQAMIEMRPCAN
jgi:hypothetical protein